MCRLACEVRGAPPKYLYARPRRFGPARRLAAALMVLLASHLRAKADPPPVDLTGLSLTELMNVEVTSVSKKEEHLLQAPAAVYVITQDDIRRSGATSIPELLRVVPGVEVARIDANKWAITARGFNSGFARKLLVLIDGRTVYDPLFGGVFWDVQDTMLEDIDRIEVIRGPGGTLWGANAVNGVINIITKRARDTLGGLVSAAGGKEERALGGVRYGAALGEHAYMRVFGKYTNRDQFVTTSGADAADDWQAGRGGFRLDWNATARDALTLQGDIYRGEVGQLTTQTSLAPPFTTTIPERDTIAGGDLLGRWRHDVAAHSTVALQLYYDRTERGMLGADQARDTFDLDLQHHFRLPAGHDIVWGIGYRFTADQTRNSFTVALTPRDRSLNLASAFAQDDITLVPDRLHFIVGSKFEHNDFTGFEFQPSGRVLWTPDRRETLWAAVSRAVRTPSRSDTDLRFNLAVIPAPGGPPTVISILGNPDIESETLLAYEIGYRLQPLASVFLDVAGFYNEYENLQTQEPEAPFVEAGTTPAYVIPRRFANGMDGETYGVEVAASWTPARWVKLSGGYDWLKEHLHLDPSSRDFSAPTQAGNDPQNQFNVRLSLNLPWRLELDGAVFYVDRLRVSGPSIINVPSYVRPDLRLGWRATDRLDLSVTVQDVLDERHAEFPSLFTSGQTVEVERAVFGQVRWHF